MKIINKKARVVYFISVFLIIASSSMAYADSPELKASNLGEIQQLINQNQRLNKLKAIIESEASSDAVENKISKLKALSPKNIINLRRAEDAITAAKIAPLYQAKQIVQTKQLDPNSPDPQTINLVNNEYSTLNFYDASGAPWPIKHIHIRSNVFKGYIQGKDNNQLLLQSNDNASKSNMVITLANLDTPIILNLNANNEKCNVKTSYIIPSVGPKSKSTSAIDAKIDTNTNSKVLMNFLTGLPPENAKKLSLVGVPGQAWSYKGFYYIRTPASLVSPNWNSSASVSGINVYKLSPTYNYLFDYSGKSLSAVINQDSEDSNNEASM